MSKKKQDVLQFIRFNIMGVVHVAVFSFVLLIAHKLNFSHFLSGAFAYITVLIVGAVGNVFYVFRAYKRKDLLLQFFTKNILIYSSSVAIELLVTYIIIPYLETTALSEVFIVGFQYAVYGIGGLYVYFMNRFFVFQDIE